MALEPTLWRTLPNELLHLVFARLHGAGIGQLRVLLKEWKRNVNSKDSEFNRAFDATTHLNMFAIQFENYTTYIYDVQVDKWHVYQKDVVRGKIATFDEAGRLLCYIWKQRRFNNEPWICIVMNPLTKHKVQFPPLLHTRAEKSNTLEIRMLKLIVDKKTKEYKVFVWAYIVGGLFDQVYDSYTKEWTIMDATHGRIIGWDPLCVYVYNFVDGLHYHYFGTDIAPGLKMKYGCYVLFEDHIFVLHKEASPNPPGLLEDGASVLPKYCISEFHLPEKTITWVKLRVHNCGPTQGIEHGELQGCNGFLLVNGSVESRIGPQRAWLYNLSTYEWRNLPSFKFHGNSKRMCMMSWIAMP